MTSEEQFWEGVNVRGPDECWLHRKKPTRGGYRQVWVSGRRRQAHRVAWELTYGAIPNGFVVRHRCPGRDSPGCCNPAHLRIGTQAENVADREADGNNDSRLHPERLARGDRNGSRLHPERIARGSRHYTRLHPEWRARGEYHGSARLTERQVLEIRAWADKGWLQKHLADAFGVSDASISKVVRHKLWRHLDST